MSQPAVSLQLKLLEEEYGASFFDRNNRGMELTTKGRAFLDAIIPVLSQIEKVEVEFKGRNRPKKTDVLIIGANHTLSATLLPEVLVDFKKRYADVQLILETSDSNTIESWVENFKVDIALISSPSYLPSCVYEAYQEQEHETVAFVPCNSSHSEKSLSLEELAVLPLVVRGGSACVEELQKRGFQLKLALQCHAPDAVKIAVEKGLGVGLLYKSWIQAEVDKGNFRLIDVPQLKNITSKSFIVHDKRKILSSSAQGFIRTLRKMRVSAPQVIQSQSA